MHVNPPSAADEGHNSVAAEGLLLGGLYVLRAGSHQNTVQERCPQCVSRIALKTHCLWVCGHQITRYRNAMQFSVACFVFFRVVHALLSLCPQINRLKNRTTQEQAGIAWEQAPRSCAIPV